MFSNLYNPFFYAMKMNKAYAFSFHDLPRMPGTCMILDEMAMPLKRHRGSGLGFWGGSGLEGSSSLSPIRLIFGPAQQG